MIHESKNHLVKHLVNRMRDINTDSQLFRSTIEELSRLLLAEAFSDRAMQKHTIQTWAENLETDRFEEDSLVFIPILRAGEPMLTGILKCLPHARSGFIAMKRDERTAKPTLFYESLPRIEGRVVILLDPMVATAGSLVDAIHHIEALKPKEIISLNIIGATEGIQLLEKETPNTSVYIAQVDPDLDENKYIRPGLGDAGDRAFHTLD